MTDRRWRKQLGSFAVETALGMSVLLGGGLLSADLYRVGIERSQLEQSAGSAALTLAVQSKLTASGLQGLSEVLTQGRADNYQLVILNVLQSGRINWGFKRGNGGDLCTALSQAGRYRGTLPEDPPASSADASDSDSDSSTMSFIVVQACRRTDNMGFSGGLTLSGPLRVLSIQRAQSLKPELDEALTSENLASGLAAMDL